MQYGCIAEHLPHSFSKEIHALIGSYQYDLKELTPEELPAFLQGKDFQGINVTIPYKQTVIPFLDHVSQTARDIGAVNTIVNKNGVLYGYNTDFDGMQRLIAKMGLELRGKNVLILGTGGTSKTAWAVAQHLGAKSICKVSRSGKDGALTYVQAQREKKDAQIIINTTPCGMYPNPEEQPVDLRLFSELEGVVDAIYNPLASRLVLQAREMGVLASGGLYMLVAQAVRAAEFFHDTAYPQSLVDSIYDRILFGKESLVLIGMPGSGKTTVGAILAEKTGRPFVDVDACVVEKAGMPIPELFARFGEPYFRDLETETIREISLHGGLVVATGGGSVLRPENVQALRQNGRLFFLDRPPEMLVATDGRPLANSREKLDRLYQERLPIYHASADHLVSNMTTPECAVEQILRASGEHTFGGNKI